MLIETDIAINRTKIILYASEEIKNLAASHNHCRDFAVFFSLLFLFIHEVKKLKHNEQLFYYLECVRNFSLLSTVLRLPIQYELRINSVWLYAIITFHLWEQQPVWMDGSLSFCFFCSSCFSSFILNANESLDRWSLISVHASQNTKHPYIAAFSSPFLFIHPTNGKIWNPNGKRKKKIIIRNKKMELLPRQMVWIKRDSIALNGVFSFTFIFFFCSLSPWRNDVVCQPISYGTKRKFDDENF